MFPSAKDEDKKADKSTGDAKDSKADKKAKKDSDLKPKEKTEIKVAAKKITRNLEEEIKQED